MGTGNPKHIPVAEAREILANMPDDERVLFNVLGGLPDPSLASETTEPPTLEQMLDCLELAAKESDDFADDGRAATARWLLAALPSLLADRDRVDALYKALDRYGAHELGCAERLYVMRGKHYREEPCHCGLAAARLRPEGAE